MSKETLTPEQVAETKACARIINTLFLKMYEIGNAADDRSVAVEQTAKLMREFAMTPEISRMLKEQSEKHNVQVDWDEVFDDLHQSTRNGDK